MSTTPGFCTAFSDYITEMKRSGEEQRAFAKGWDAAMKFMSSPRMPAPATGNPPRQYYIPTPVRPELAQLAERFVGESKMSIRLVDGTVVPSPVTEEDLKSWDFHNGVAAGKAVFGEALPLVAFYTDAP